MTALRHSYMSGVRVLRETNRVSSPVAPRTRSELSANRKQLLRLAWRRSARTGELRGRWELSAGFGFGRCACH